MLAACDEVGDLLQLKFSSGVAGGAELVDEECEKGELEKAGAAAMQLVANPPRWRLEEVLKRGVDDVKVPLR